MAHQQHAQLVAPADELVLDDALLVGARQFWPASSCSESTASSQGGRRSALSAGSAARRPRPAVRYSAIEIDSACVIRKPCCAPARGTQLRTRVLAPGRCR
jgi:hypothetical protein